MSVLEKSMPWGLAILLGLVLAGTFVVARKLERSKFQTAHACAHFEVDAKTGQTTRVVTCEICKESE